LQQIIATNVICSKLHHLIICGTLHYQIVSIVSIESKPNPIDY